MSIRAPERSSVILLPTLVLRYALVNRPVRASSSPSLSSLSSDCVVMTLRRPPSATALSLASFVCPISGSTVYPSLSIKMNTSAMSGSNWLPLQRRNSEIILSVDSFDLYTLSEFMASYASATAMTLATAGISSPVSPFG